MKAVARAQLQHGRFARVAAAALWLFGSSNASRRCKQVRLKRACIRAMQRLHSLAFLLECMRTHTCVYINIHPPTLPLMNASCTQLQ